MDEASVPGAPAVLVIRCCDVQGVCRLSRCICQVAVVSVLVSCFFSSTRRPLHPPFRASAPDMSVCVGMFVRLYVVMFVCVYACTLVCVPCWAHLGPLCAILAHLGAFMGPLGAILGSSWALLGPPWGHPVVILGHLGAMLGPP